MDYSKLSDAQLVAMHSGDYSKLSDEDLSSLHAQQQPQESTLSKVGRLAKEFFITGHPNAPGKEPVEPSIGKTLAYPGGVVSTGVIQGAKQAIDGSGSMDDFKQALKGDAKSAPDQLQEAGLSPAASYAAGIPLQVATDPFNQFMALRTPGAQAAPSVGNYISQRLANKAGRMAEKATGGTPTQLREIEGSGQTMLKNGIVKPLSGPSDIAENAQNAIEEAYRAAPLESASIGPGAASVKKADILKGLDAKIAEFAQDESKASVMAQLQKIRDNVATDAIPAERSLVAAEGVKKGFANPQNWENPLQGQAPKAASGVYRDLVEKGAAEYSPELGQKYTDAKSLYKTLDPVVETAQAGAARQAARPAVTLKDILSLGAGGPKGFVAQRILTSPRLQSTGAVALHAASGLATNPNPVASVIASRLGQSGQNMSQSVSQSRGIGPNAPIASQSDLRSGLIGQQTDPQAQQDLYDSQK